jgi:HD-GYP domain-containing protein (c-di-GMP phosphodiesterase class II)
MELSEGLAQQKVTPGTKIAILQDRGGVIALSDPGRELPFHIDEVNSRIHMPSLSDLDDPVYQALNAHFGEEVSSHGEPMTVEGQEWLVSVTDLPTRSRQNVYLAVLIPRDELLASVVRLRNNGALISTAVLLAALMVVLAVSRNISGSLGQLAREAEEVRQLKLDSPITVGSRIREVDDLAETMSVMKSSLRQFLEISDALSAEKDFNKILEMILAEATRVSGADGGAVLLLSDDEKSLDAAIQINKVLGTHYGGTSGVSTPIESVELDTDRRKNARPSIASGTVEKGTIVKIDDLDLETRFELERVHSHFETENYKVRSLLSVPLRNQLDETIGVLQLVNARGADSEIVGFRPEIVPYIEALSSDAAVALDIRRLLKAQRDLLDSLIHMIAGAIDAKSPYTSGHCQRVPIAARMLAEAAHNSNEGPLADFHFSDDEWYQLHLASWLHDCGKLTTPEYVVDKATKLETIYNRIHEIRTRFEVLWRDAEIEYLKARLGTNRDHEELRAQFEERTAQIRQDFEFVAECNVGGGFMTEEKIERVRQIGTQTWIRHLDDRLGLSHGELDLRPEESTTLPATEPLLADKPSQILPRPAAQNPFGDEPHNFRIDVPVHQYNRGEIHNLSIARGTLTTEERFKINEHVIQTIRMLEQLPFPKEQRQVPDWAGTHHEKLDGTGYPCRLSSEDLAVPDRVMAIADIFEALTASDRPYHAPKTLSQTVGIMSSMCSEGHLCPDLFSLFLTSGTYLEYAEEHLRPDQIDEVDVDSTVAALG